ncbi:MAG TPA: hypothetical protein VHR66_08270 [Gemmataceae bacterium]|jgi:uncharacterized protein with gpF-like domain|nr:hypothetical protein [Gemmataceae bacterium]
MGNNRLIRRRFALAAVGLIATAFTGCGKPPQIGTDEHAHKTVDALFTAITARNTERLNRVETQLIALQTSGQLPKEVMKELAKFIARARSGKWEPAAEQLYDFIRGQTTAPEPSTPAKHSPKGR